MSIYDVLDSLPVTHRQAYAAVKAVQGRWISSDECQSLIELVKESGAALRWDHERRAGSTDVRITTITIG